MAKTLDKDKSVVEAPKSGRFDPDAYAAKIRREVAELGVKRTYPGTDYLYYDERYEEPIHKN